MKSTILRINIFLFLETNNKNHLTIKLEEFVGK